MEILNREGLDDDDDLHKLSFRMPTINNMLDRFPEINNPDLVMFYLKLF